MLSPTTFLVIDYCQHNSEMGDGGFWQWTGFRHCGLTRKLLHIYQDAVSKLWFTTSSVAMGEFKHFVIVKFKEGAVVEDLTKGMEKLVSEIDAVKSFEW